MRELPQESKRLLLKNSISLILLHKTLVLLDAIKSDHENKFRNQELLALAKALVTTIGNLRFGPEVGLGIMDQVPTEWVLKNLFSLRKAKTSTFSRECLLD